MKEHINLRPHIRPITEHDVWMADFNALYATGTSKPEAVSYANAKEQERQYRLLNGW